MCAPSPPPPPDYRGAAVAQGEANADAARIQGRMNNPNVYGPTGSQTVSWDGDTPTITQQLSPLEEVIYRIGAENRRGMGLLANQGIGSLSGIVGTDLDMSGAPAAPGSYTPVSGPQALDPRSLPNMPQAYQGARNLPDMPEASEQLREKVIGAMMSRSNAAIDRRADQARSDLIAAGIRPGTEAYAREMDAIERARNDAYTQAEIAGGNATEQAFGMDLSRRKQGYSEALGDANLTFQQGMGVRGQALDEQRTRFGQQGQGVELGMRQQGQQFGQQSDARRQAIAEILTRRQTPLNEIIALMGGAPVNNPFAMPGAAQNTNVAPAPIFGAADASGRYNTDLYNAEVGNSNAQMQGLSSAALMALAYFF